MRAKKAKQTARRCANKFKVELSQKIRLAANNGDVHGMYYGIKKVIGPIQTHHPKLSTGVELTEKSKQMDQWVKYYSIL